MFVDVGGGTNWLAHDVKMDSSAVAWGWVGEREGRKDLVAQSVAVHFSFSYFLVIIVRGWQVVYSHCVFHCPP